MRSEVPEKPTKYDRKFRVGAVRGVKETAGSSRTLRDLGLQQGTPGPWVARNRQAREGRGELSKGMSRS